MKKLAATLSPNNAKPVTHHPAPNKSHSFDENSSKKAKSLTKPKLKESKSIKIPRNVNFYRHLLTEQNASEHGIEWALQLRSPLGNQQNIGKPEPTSIIPFSISDKSLEGQTDKRNTLDLDNKGDLHGVIHLINHRMGPTPSKGTVNFESALRTYGNSSEALKTMEKKWCPLPKRERLWEPAQLYPSYEETRRLTNWSTKNQNIKTHSAFDSLTNYPKYGLNKSSSKNIAEIAHLFAEKGQTVPNMNWQSSMRNYASTNKIKLPEEGELGELKKVNKKPNRL